MSNSKGMYVSAVRDHTVRTKSGHILRFKKGVPKYVPPEVRHLVLQGAILPVDGNMPVEEEKEVAPRPLGDDRRERIFQAVSLLAELNDVEDFTGSNVPKTTSVKREVGFEVDARERDEAWERYLQVNGG